MKLFITGISGLLGLNLALQGKEIFAVSGTFHSRPVAMEGVEAIQLDVTSLPATKQGLAAIRPDLVIHTVAATNLEECERNPSLASQLNVDAARNVATATASLNAKLVHISTDQLFDGTRPLCTETDTLSPLNTYARTKMLGEQAVLDACPGALVVRTNFFGWGTSARSSFSDWILQGLQHRKELAMFSDVFFTPILINHLVDVIFNLVWKNAAGLFNVGGGERLSKHAFALRLAETFGYSTDCIRPISLSPVNQLERVAVRFRALMSEHYQISRQATNDVEDGSIARSLFPEILRNPFHLSVQRCNREGRLLERQALDDLVQLSRYNTQLASISPPPARQGCQPKPLVPHDPPLGRPERNTSLDCHRAQWAALLQMWLQQMEPIQRQLPNLVRETSQFIHPSMLRQIT